MWQGIAEGKEGRFENGVTPVFEDEVITDVVELNIGKLTAAIGKNRYTQLLDRFSDLSNITYAYGKTDQAVGSLTDAEIEFLASKNVNILSSEGGHDAPYFELAIPAFKTTFGFK